MPAFLSAGGDWPPPGHILASATALPPTLTRTPFQPLPTLTSTRVPTRTTAPSATQSPSATVTPLPTQTIEETVETTEPWPPSSASIEYIAGYPQSYNLDCESRSAVDFAAYFGVHLNEQAFLDSLPLSDDPNEGFVGSYNGYPGQIPPNSYGVHADPIAQHLSLNGMPARAVHGASWQDIQQEIASGRPVIVWVMVGLAQGQPIEYTPSNGQTTIVAYNEHTVIVTSYDENRVTVLDGGSLYGSTLQKFLDSWSVLGNMAVFADIEN